MGEITNKHKLSLIARSSIIIAVFFGLDKILGFVRQVLIARQFGLSYEIDAFNAANNIPDLLSALISGGALGVALIPVISEYLQLKGRPSAWDLFSRILNLAFLVTAGISALIILFAAPLVHSVIAPGFPPEQQALTISLMRWDLIAIIIFSISGLVMAGLQANQHFLLPAMAPGMYNIGQIFGVLILAPAVGYSFGGITLPAFGLGIYGLVYGVIIGSLLHLLIQVPALIHYKFRWTPAINLRDPGVQQVLRLLGPRVLTMFFLQIFFIARDNLASGLGEGSVTALNYGWFIMQVSAEVSALSESAPFPTDQITCPNSCETAAYQGGATATFGLLEDGWPPVSDDLAIATSCVSSCQVDCQAGCQHFCQSGSCQYGACETSCTLGGCITSCMYWCQTTGCEGATACETQCQAYCESTVQSCTLSCTNSSESVFMDAIADYCSRVVQVGYVWIDPALSCVLLRGG